MADYFEIDFLGVETAKSGDAITLRYSVNGTAGVHVVDGGYLDTGDQIVEHLKTYYGTTVIDHVILTLPDRDHANGLRKVRVAPQESVERLHQRVVRRSERLPSL